MGRQSVLEWNEMNCITMHKCTEMCSKRPEYTGECQSCSFCSPYVEQRTDYKMIVFGSWNGKICLKCVKYLQYWRLWRGFHTGPVLLGWVVIPVSHFRSTTDHKSIRAFQTALAVSEEEMSSFSFWFTITKYLINTLWILSDNPCKVEQYCT